MKNEQAPVLRYDDQPDDGIIQDLGLGEAHPEIAEAMAFVKNQERARFERRIAIATAIGGTAFAGGVAAAKGLVSWRRHRLAHA